MSVDELKAALTETKKQCKIEMNLSDDIVTDVKTYDKNMPREAKCFQACLVQKFGIMGDDLKIDKDEILKNAANFLGYDKEKIEIASKKLNECNFHAETDRCEAANEFFRCVFQFQEAMKLKELL